MNIPLDVEGGEPDKENNQNYSNLGDNDSDFTPLKRRRSSSSNEQMKFFEMLAKNMQENQSKKMEIFQQAINPQTELELFFASLCKTVEKFDALEQAEVKIQLTNSIVSQAELAHLEKAATSMKDLTYTIRTEPTSDEIFTVENKTIVISDV